MAHHRPYCNRPPRRGLGRLNGRCGKPPEVTVPRQLSNALGAYAQRASRGSAMRFVLVAATLLLPSCRACADVNALNYGVSGALCSNVEPTLACSDPTAENYSAPAPGAHRGKGVGPHPAREHREMADAHEKRFSPSP
eukprot:2661543-Prymnesium_polylepis.1